MHLKSLELAGFKSFAKKCALDFSAPISAVVGPNGSGKSNIVEAFRFVLGEQSIKSMRGKKTEDLIFNGSNEAPRMSRASVKIIFDNSKRFLNVDFDEVSVERVIYRDSVSEYLINGTQVRLKDIVELLSGAHIGASGHQIISQGEADRILNANSKERKEMLEDALGLKIYQYKRQESERKLEKTEENIRQVESLRRELVPHLKFLKKQVEKVEKANEMREDLKKLYAEYLRREDVFLKWRKKKLAEELAKPEAELKTLEKEFAEAKDALEKSKHKDEKSEEVIRLEREIKSVQAKKDEITRSAGRLEGELGSAERALRREKESAASDASRTVAFADVKNLVAEVESAAGAGENESNLENLRGILRKIRELVSNFIKARADAGHKNSAEALENEIRALKEQKQKSEEELARLKSEEENLQAKYAAVKLQIESDKDVGRDAEKALFRIVALQNEKRGELNAVKSREDALRINEENFKMELKEGAALIGRAVLDYENFAPVAEDGRKFSDDEIAGEPRPAQEERRRAIEKIKIRLEDAGAGGGEDVLKEFKDVSERDQFLSRELLDLGKSKESLKLLIKDLSERLDAEFKSGIEKINKQFQEFFALMFGGGTAGLSVVREKKKQMLTDEELSALGMGEISKFGGEGAEIAEEEEGIEINVSLPRKKIKGLVMLSGGERALTSIALIFAVSQVNPPPFIVLDETDAALDEANSKKYGDMIASLAKYSQLILVTHNRETMSRAGNIYGVTMAQGGISKILSIQFEEAAEIAK